MSIYKKLFQNTFIYGVATVIPRMLSVILVPLYTGVLENTSFGDYSIIFSYFVIFNVILAYGMETAFFRFYNKEKDKSQVVYTSTWSIITTTLVFVILAYLSISEIQSFTRISTQNLKLIIWILALDALAIIPFSWLRANSKPVKFAIIKTLNVAINLGLNVFFLLYLKDLAESSDFFKSIYIPNFEVSYIFISLIIASAITLLLLIPFYSKIQFQFDWKLWKSMMKYALPVLVAGVAFSINEVIDRLFLERMLPENIAKEQVGIYSACYKLGMFMTLFATAFRLGIEPFFFSHASSKNPKTAYAMITKYFVIIGTVILLVVIVFADLFKVLFIQNESYWEAMKIVPIILLANLFLGIYHNLSVWYKVTDKTQYGAYISSLGAIFTIGINIWLIPTIGYVGSAIATLVAYGSMMLISFFLGQKHYAIPYKYGKMLIYLSISVLFSLISFYYFRENYVVGVSLILIFCFSVFISEKKEIFRLIKSN
ncbi:oligosaccharide flippase family protein [Psychroflexus sp. CAK8W]|uniref:Oligosaccharide flippase family protein n=1 Tax=Psychroflexus longus TaxID=2873596 RepID=A0ABS7XH73_9FLAO|nr:oligosaccharide flippase family protein [Psychroflexus longus]MBZ9777784.1 oligosaccharide flippase family protein [Psychroflexus longus]